MFFAPFTEGPYNRPVEDTEQENRQQQLSDRQSASCNILATMTSLPFQFSSALFHWLTNSVFEAATSSYTCMDHDERQTIGL